MWTGNRISVHSVIAAERSARGELADRRRRGRALTLVERQRAQREDRRVEVVAQIEHLRESGRGPVVVLPGAVVLLFREEVADAAADRLRVAVAGGEQRDERPRGLRRRRRALSLGGRVVVGVRQLAPAAVGVLVRADPLRRLLEALLAQVLSGVEQAAQREERAIQVVAAPAAVPRSVAELRLVEERGGAAHGGVSGRNADRVERLERAA